MCDDPVVELCHVSYQAGGKRIIDDVSWQILKGEPWAVLGPNGAGKTILMRIVAGFLWPNAGGCVRRCGNELLDLRLLRRSIGWVSVSMIRSIPAAEQVLDTVVSGRFAQLGLKPVAWDRPSDDDYQRARDHLHRLRCTDLIAKTFGVLSQGEQQKVLLARARMADPLLIVLDEPCAGLDPGARERFLGTITELVSNPDAPSLVLITHHVEEVVPGIEQIVVMHQGRIHRQGAAETVLQMGVLSEVYRRPLRRLVCLDGRYWPIW